MMLVKFIAVNGAKLIFKAYSIFPLLNFCWFNSNSCSFKKFIF